MRKANVPLRDMVEIIAACILLYNMCIQVDKVDTKYIEEVKKKTEKIDKE
jgi:hypothetical protein